VSILLLRVTSDNNETVKQEEHNTAITTNNVQREKPQNSFSHTLRGRSRRACRLPPNRATNPENFVRIHLRFFAVASPKVSEISKICFGSQKISGGRGLNLPHQREGYNTEIRCVHGASSFVAPLILRELVKKRQKFDHFLRGHSAAPVSKFKKINKTSGCFFVLNPQKTYATF